MAREKVEDSLVLDVLDFARKGHLAQGARGTRRWARGDRKPTVLAGRSKMMASVSSTPTPSGMAARSTTPIGCS